MGLLERIDGEMREALKTGDKLKLSTIRMIRAAVHNKEIEKRGKLTEEEIVQTLSSMAKNTRESIEQFQKGKRVDLVEKEQAELQILLSFMPRQMSQEEIRAVADRTIEELQASGMKDLGAVMKALMARLKGQADGRLVNEIVKERLSR